MSQRNGARSFVDDLVALWPGLPYLGFGALSAWILLAYSGTFWLSNTEIDGRYISQMYLLSTGVFAVLMLTVSFLPVRIQILLKHMTLAYLGAFATGIGALSIILAGPYYLGISWLFYFGSVLTGIGTVFLALKCGYLYGQLDPGKVVVYIVLSQLFVAAIYFVFLGTEWYHPIDGGPSLSGIIGLVFLPLVSAFLITLPTPAQEGESEALGKMHFSVKRIPVSFWKLCVAVFVFAIVTSVVRGLATHFEAPGTILIYSNLLMLFRLLFAVAFLYFTFRAVRRINFGKLYLVLMVGISIAVTLASSMQLYNGGFFTLFVGFSLDVFDILLWCMLAFIAHQSRASYLVVFGFGRGAFTLGGVIGWMIGAWLVPMITSAFWISLLFVLLATLVLVCAVLVFSEKDFDRLFSSILESELNLEDLAYQIGTGMGQNDKDDNFERTRPYAEACKNVAATFHLTEREQDIFELLAVGRGSEGIAERLHISSNTVRTHTQNIYAKLGVHSRHELMTLVESTKDNTIPANK